MLSMNKKTCHELTKVTTACCPYASAFVSMQCLHFGTTNTFHNFLLLYRYICCIYIFFLFWTVFFSFIYYIDRN